MNCKVDLWHHLVEKCEKHEGLDKTMIFCSQREREESEQEQERKENERGRERYLYLTVLLVPAVSLVPAVLLVPAVSAGSSNVH